MIISPRMRNRGSALAYQILVRDSPVFDKDWSLACGRLFKKSDRGTVRSQVGRDAAFDVWFGALDCFGPKACKI